MHIGRQASRDATWEELVEQRAELGRVELAVAVGVEGVKGTRELVDARACQIWKGCRGETTTTMTAAAAATTAAAVAAAAVATTTTTTTTHLRAASSHTAVEAHGSLPRHPC